MEKNKFEIDVKNILILLNYLGKKPYVEVNGLITSLRNLKKIEENKNGQ